MRAGNRLESLSLPCRERTSGQCADAPAVFPYRGHLKRDTAENDGTARAHSERANGGEFE